jgi:hypothetical protein
MDKFVYFWIPNFNSFKCNLKPQLKKQDISDNIENKRNILEIELLNNFDIKVKYNNQKYVLNYIIHNDKGIFIYKFKNIDKELLKIQIYHLFKEICHNHTSHNDEEDSLLQAYISDSDNNIKEAIEFYSQIYINKFKEYRNIINEFINVNLNEFKIDEIVVQKKLLLKAKEEILYALFLSKDSEFYYQFINFEKKFDILFEKLNLKESEKLFKVNNIINIWQFILAGLGIFLAIIGLYFAFNGADYNLQKIEQLKIEQLSKKIENQKQLIEKLNKQIIKMKDKK